MEPADAAATFQEESPFDPIRTECRGRADHSSGPNCELGRTHAQTRYHRHRSAEDSRRSAALAVGVDHPPRQSHPPQRRRAEGRRAPGVMLVDDRDHGGALLSRARAQRPGRGQAARRAGAPRDPLSARQPVARAAREFPRLRRRAKLPEPDQGQDPGRLLDRLRRPRSRDHALRQPGAGLSDRARPDATKPTAAASSR